MAKAKIEIKSKDVAGFPGEARHLYIVYTNDSGESRVIRGGPEGNNIPGMVWGDIEVLDRPYTENHPENDFKDPPDWDSDNSHQSMTIFEGSNEDMLTKVNLMKQEMNRINSEGYDYNLPWVEALIGDGWAGGLDDQNSNTVAMKLAQAADLENGVLTFLSENGIQAPGYLSDLEHSAFERNMDSLADTLESTGRSAWSFANDLADNLEDNIGSLIQETQDFFGDLFSKDEASHTPDDTSAINNSLLNFESTISPFSNNALMDPENAWLEEGAAIHGGDYKAVTDLNIINGPGFTYEQMMKNVTDDWQPGDMTLTDNQVDYGIDSFLDKYFEVPSIDLDPDPPSNIFDQPFDDYMGDLAKMNNLYLAAPEVERVDPLVIDLNGDGVQLVSFEDSTVTFDVDNDGYAENTGWVSAEDGIVVHDKNQDGLINDISETISEYYTDNVVDGLEALQTLDSNNDGLFNTFDDAWSDLKVWQDQNQDGISQADEMQTLDEAGIASISLDRQERDRERLEGNPVLSRSSMRMTDGTQREVAAVDFTTNPVGYEWNDVFDGAEVKSENGESSSFVITASEGQTVNATEKNVNSIYGNIGDDTLIGNDEANWLIGGAGSDTFQAGAGDDLLVVDADDLQENIDAGDGLDIVRVADNRDVSLNLSEINAEILNSGGGNDVLIGGGLSNVFINGGAGADVLIGGAADDALAGEDGNDMLDGGYGDDILRGHRGEDLIIGGQGNDYMDGGLDDDVLKGGSGDDILIGGKGSDTIDGGAGFDMVEYKGRYDQYVVRKTESGFEIDDLEDGTTDYVTNIERLRFDGVDITLEGNDTSQAPLPVKDTVEVSGDGPFVIDPATLLANDFDLDGDQLRIKTVEDAVGGTVTLREDGMVEFIPGQYFMGMMSFDYTVEDIHGNSMTVYRKGDEDNAVPLKAQVNLRNTDDPSDPLFYEQWYLSEINIKSAWADYTGEGVHVGVFEGDSNNPLNHLHPDLDDNIAEDYQIFDEDIDHYSNHATLVAGVIGAENNDIGSIGVAYDAALTGYSWNPDGSGLMHMMDVDVANNSWGHTLPFVDYMEGNGDSQNWRNEEFLRAYDNAVNYGRGGLGTSIVFAGGNERQEGGNTNHFNINSHRFGITTGSINQEGDLSKLIEAADPFSNPGASILVSAPGSNIQSTANMVENDNGSTFGSDSESTQGTSFSTPIISGVVALLLEANPNLGYRDIQKILAYSAQIVEDADTDWNYNGASNWNGGAMHAGHDYGYGIVDVHAAIRLAETWTEISTLINEESVSVENSDPLTLADNGTVTSIVVVDSELQVENVEITVDLDHSRIGDLTLTLVSPDGTESILIDRPGKVPGSDAGDLGLDQEDLTFTFTSTHHLGESASGTWQLKVTDAVTGETGTLNNWTLRLYGAVTEGDTYIFTNEYGNNDAGNRVIQDDTGVDTINAAAVVTDSVINLNSDGVSTINGTELRFSQNGIPEDFEDKQTELASKQSELADNQNNLQSKQDSITVKEAELQAKIQQHSEKYDAYQAKILEQPATTQASIDAKLNEYQSLINSTQHQDNIAAYNSLSVYVFNGAVSFPTGGTVYMWVNKNNYDDFMTLSYQEHNDRVNQMNNLVNQINSTQDQASALYDQYVALFNARKNEIETLRNEAEVIRTEANGLVSEIQTLQDELDALPNEIAELQSTISTLITDISNLENYLENAVSNTDTVIENAIAGDGNDTLIGNSGDNVLFDGRGSDQLTGNAGADTFQIKAHAGDTDTITDFSLSDGDTLDLSDFELASFDDLAISQSGTDTLIDFTNGQTLILQNMDAAQLTDAHFSGFLNDAEILSGTSKNDTLYGSERDTVIQAGEGHDHISGNAGTNTLTGGEGADTFFITKNSAGSDTITDFNASDINERIVLRQFKDIHSIDDLSIRQDGHNTVIELPDQQKIILENIEASQLSNDNFVFSGQLLGSDRNNVLLGSELSDLIYAGDGDDHVEGRQGHDTISGGKGADTLYGQSGHDILYGNSGDDLLFGGSGNNHLYGGTGQDILVSDSGNDTLIGGGGSDQFVVYEKPNTTTTIEDFDLTNINEKIDLSFMDNVSSPDDFSLTQNGSDTEIYFPDNQKIIVKNVDKDSLSLENFVIRNVFQVEGDFDGSSEQEVFIGNDLENMINGFAGDDYLAGYGGNDWLHGGGGHDKLYGGLGDDHLYGDGSRDWVSLDIVGFESEAGNDELYGGEGDDVLLGGLGNDLLSGGSGNNTLIGGDGADRFVMTQAASSDMFFSSPVDVIEDFDLTEANEKIDLSLIKNVYDFSDLALEQHGDHTYVILPKDSFIGYNQVIILQYVNAGNLNATHFTGFNEAPELGDDLITVQEDQSVIFAPLDNDADDKTDLSDVSITLGTPQNGFAVLNEDGTVTYTASPNFYGSDHFTYTVTDSGGLSTTATVSVEVSPVNDAPVIQFEGIESFSSSPIRLDVLSQTTDIEGDALSIQSVSNGQYGTAVIENGRIIYTPGEEFTGSDEIEASVADAQGGLSTKTISITPLSVTEDTVVTIDVSATQPGTGYQLDSVSTPAHGLAEIIDGKITYTPDADYFGPESFEYTLLDAEGNPVVKTAAFNISAVNDAPRLNPAFSLPAIVAGQAFDFSLNTLFIDDDGDSLSYQAALINEDSLPYWLTLDQETGIIQGTAPLDISEIDLNLTARDDSGAEHSENIKLQILDRVINGTGSDDVLTGTELNEKIEGHDGADTLKGEDGRDWIEGGLGDDIIRGGRGNDILFGNDGQDMLYAGWGQDQLYGGAGNDTLRGDVGRDILDGGAGDDVLISYASGDTLIGGTGTDTFVINDDIMSTDRIKDFDPLTEKIDLSAFQNYVTDVAQLTFEQVGSHTHIEFPNISKTLILENIQANELTGDEFIGLSNNQNSTENMVLEGTEADDDLHAGLGHDVLSGGLGDDALHGNEGNDKLEGGAGKDHLYGNGGNDLLTGGEDGDTFVFEAQANAMDIITDFKVPEELVQQAVTDMDAYELNQLVSYLNADLNFQDARAALDRWVYLNELDRIDVSGIEGMNTFADMTLSQEGADTHILLPDSQLIVLQNVDKTTLTEDSFIFDASETPLTPSANRDDIICPTWSTQFDPLVLVGTEADEYIYGGWEDDIIRGSGGDDVVKGGRENDKVYGDDGNDLLVGGVRGHDLLTGGAGSDHFLIYGNWVGGSDTIADFDILDPNEKIDLSAFRSFSTLELFEYRGSTIIKLDYSQKLIIQGVTPDELTPDHFIGLSDTVDIQNKGTLSSYDAYPYDYPIEYVPEEILTGTEAHDELTGFLNADTLSGEGGNDVLVGDKGNDTLLGGAGDDILHGGLPSYWSYEYSEEEQRSIKTDPHGDNGGGNDHLDGGAGADKLYGGLGNDVLTGGEGADTFIFEPGYSNDAEESDTITDFEVDNANEKIDLRQFVYVNSLDDLTITQNGDHTEIKIPHYHQFTQMHRTVEDFWNYGQYSAEQVESLVQVGDDLAVTLKKIHTITLENTAASDLLPEHFKFYNHQFVGTEANDYLYGHEGHDVVTGLAGNDQLSGGSGNDRLDGGMGNDILRASEGTDRLIGGDGSDTFIISPDNFTRLVGSHVIQDFEAGNPGEVLRFEYIQGVYGIQDISFTQDGNDTLVTVGLNSENGDIRLENVLSDQILAEQIQVLSKIEGSDYNDKLVGLDNTMYPDQATHKIQFGHSGSFSTNGVGLVMSSDGTFYKPNDFDPTTDILQILGSAFSDFSELQFEQDLDAAVITLSEGEYITFSGIHVDDFSADNFMFYETQLFNNSGDNEITAGRGHDYIEAGDGNDIVYGDENYYSTYYGSGENPYLTKEGNDIIFGGAGQDTLYGKGGNDVLDGGEDDDVLIGGEGNDILHGGSGSDRLSAGSQYGWDSGDGERLYGEAGNDTLEMRGSTQENAVLDGGAGDDSITFSGSGSNNSILGGDGQDTISARNLSGTNLIDGGNDDDLITVESSRSATDANTILGGQGHDNIRVHFGHNIIDAGDGNDTLTIGEGSHIVTGGTGIDLYTIHENLAGETIITDFDVESEVLNLQYILSLSSFDDIEVLQENNDVTLQLSNGQVIRLQNTDTSEIDASHFIFSVKGTESRDLIRGTSYDDIILAGGDDDVIIGGYGNDTLLGEEGNDVFVIHQEDGSEDFISDFESGEKIALLNFEWLQSFDDLVITYWETEYMLEDGSWLESYLAAIDLGNGQMLRVDNLSEQNYLNESHFFFQDLAPVVQDNGKSLDEDHTVTINLLDNVSDDLDNLLGAENIRLHTLPQYGTIILNEDGSVTYTPGNEFNGLDSFTYSVVDFQGNESDIANVNIYVRSVNDAPVAVVERARTQEDQSILIAVLAGAVDMDGDTLSIESITSPNHGTAIIEGDRIRYTANENYYGEDSFDYTISDGNGGFVTQTMTLLIDPVNDGIRLKKSIPTWDVQTGDAFEFTLTDSLIEDIEGDAEISIALKNGDVLPDWLHYDANTYQFSGTPDADYAGQVISIEITAKDDVSEIKTNFHIAIASVLGSDANDILTDTPGDDIISGGAGNDELISGLGTDLLLGGEGDDTFDYAEDAVWTSEYFAYNTDTGDKVAIIGMKRSYDVFDGGDGIDVLKLTSDNDAYFLDDGYSPTQTGDGRLSNVEKIEAGAGHDIVDLSSSRFTYGDIEIKGGDGNDVVWGNAGNDTLYGDAGDDNVQGGQGNDTLYGGSGADTLKGFTGQDKLEGGTGADNLFGGADADVFVFSKLEDSTTTEMDTIQDFSQGEDQVDVSQLDFNSLDDFQFTFDGTDTIVNTVDDEFAFSLSGEHSLTDNDFIFA